MNCLPMPLQKLFNIQDAIVIQGTQCFAESGLTEV